MRSVGPDSKQSWVVAFATFIIQIMAFGLVEVSGLFFVATIPRFNTNRQLASLPYTLTYCVRSALGPLIGYLGSRFGIRRVTLIGCVLSAIFVGVCFFVEDIVSLIILFGVGFGFALGLETSLLNVILNEHFVKNRVKANGLNASGCSIGNMILSPLVSYLIEDAYGLSGTFLIISGLMLNSIPAAIIIILNKPDPHEEDIDTYTSDTESVLKVRTSLAPVTDVKVERFSNSDVQKETSQNHALNEEVKENGIYGSCENSKSTLALIQKEQCDPSSNGQKSPEMSPPLSRDENQSTDTSLCEMNNAAWKNNGAYFNNSFEVENNANERVMTNNLSVQSPNIAVDSENDKSLLSSTTRKTEDNSKWQIYRLACNPVYLVLLVGSGTYYFSVTTFLTIIVDFATDIGVSFTLSTYILMWVGLWDIIAYATLGFIFEKRYFTQSQFASLSYLGMCLTFAAIVWSPSYIVLLFLITLFEFSQAGVIILSAPLVAELIDQDLQATAIASVTLLSAPVSLAISPLIGLFRDGFGSYTGMFYLNSVTLFLCSLLFLCIPKAKQHLNS